MRRDFWRGRRVFITGHTGFKGSWLTLWLRQAGAEITGYSLRPPSTPNLFDEARVADGITSIIADVRDRSALRDAIRRSDAEVVLHLAAQSLVRPSYESPAETYEVNVMGTVNVLDAVREQPGVRLAVIVTSDKCYENREWEWAYREDDRLGGKDPYSNSKACAELVTSAYRQSFFSAPDAARVVTVRAGNVIGGGDWARDRLVPDLVRAFGAGEPAVIRNPRSTRPWQFVLDPLNGYLELAEAMLSERGAGLPDEWNFGPSPADVRPVQWIADRMVDVWGGTAAWRQQSGDDPPEARSLTLDSARARERLGWHSRLDAASAIDWTVSWYHSWRENPSCAPAITVAQIDAFEGAGR